MEEVMFCEYLKFAERKKLSVWKSKKSLKKVKCFFVLLTSICIILSLVLFWECLTAPKWSDYKIYSIFIMAVPSISMFLLSEQTKIKNKLFNLNEYRKYYVHLLNWLKSNDYTTIQSIQSLHDRILDRVSEDETPHKEQHARFDNWVQSLGIPLMILTITAFIDYSATLSDMNAYIFSAIFFCFVLYFSILFCKSYLWLPSKYKLEQMRCFASDLQGVLDLQGIENSKETISRAAEKDSDNVKMDAPTPSSKKAKRKRK